MMKQFQNGNFMKKKISETQQKILNSITTDDWFDAYHINFFKNVKFQLKKLVELGYLKSRIKNFENILYPDFVFEMEYKRIQDL